MLRRHVPRRATRSLLMSAAAAWRGRQHARRQLPVISLLIHSTLLYCSVFIANRLSSTTLSEISERLFQLVVGNIRFKSSSAVVVSRRQSVLVASCYLLTNGEYSPWCIQLFCKCGGDVVVSYNYQYFDMLIAFFVL